MLLASELGAAQEGLQEKALKTRFRLCPWFPDAFYQPSGVLVLSVDGKKAGRLSIGNGPVPENHPWKEW